MCESKSRRVCSFLFLAMASIVTCDAQQSESAIPSDRAILEGTWRVVELVADGHVVNLEQTGKLTVINGRDGTWNLFIDDEQEIGGKSTLDPSKSPKTIDFTSFDKQGNITRYVGIYELGETTRRLCFTEGDDKRPTEFTSEPGSGWTLVNFKRVTDKP